MNQQAEISRIREVYKQRMEPEIAGRYAADEPGERYRLQRFDAALRKQLSAHQLDKLANAKILEIGCGRGLRLMDWLRLGAQEENLYGLDLMPEFITKAKQHLPKAHLEVADASQLHFANESFDLVTQYTVFTSILDVALKQQIAAEMFRVLKPGGAIVWYDFRYPNPKNPDVRAISVTEIQQLFPQGRVDAQSLTLLPPLARRLSRISPLLCRVLESFPLLRSHYLAIIRK